MKHLLIAAFETRQNTALAIGELLEHHFHTKDISLLGKDKRELSIICKDTGVKEPVAGHGNTGLFGEIKDLTSSIMLRDQVTWASGHAAAKLAGAKIGKEHDGLIISLVGIGIPKEDAGKYQELLLEGHILILLECTPERSDEAQRILGSHHVISIR